METLNNIPCVSDETKEACAIETMRYMLQQYAQDHQLTFEDAFFAFSTSSAGILLDITLFTAVSVKSLAMLNSS